MNQMRFYFVCAREVKKPALVLSAEILYFGALIQAKHSAMEVQRLVARRHALLEKLGNTL
jgi:hypothetical protein